jgi:hypothetical protein
MSAGSTPSVPAISPSERPSARSGAMRAPFLTKWRRSCSTLVIIRSPATRTLWVCEYPSGGATWATTFGAAGSRMSMIDVPSGGFMCPT